MPDTTKLNLSREEVLAPFEAHLATLKDKRVAILIPTLDGRIEGGLAARLALEMQVLSKFGIRCDIHFDSDSHINRNRNMLTYGALASGADYLMWIDSDIIFETGAISLLLGSNKDLIGGGYPIKKLEMDRIMKALDAGVNPAYVFSYATRNVVKYVTDGTRNVVSHEPLPIDHLGTGFMLVKREVFAKIEPLLSEELNCALSPEHMRRFLGDTSGPIRSYPAYFHSDGIKMVVAGHPTPVFDYLTEDYFFCHMAKKAGVTPYVLPMIQLQHVGKFVFTGDWLRSMGVIYPAERLAKPETKKARKKKGK